MVRNSKTRDSYILLDTANWQVSNSSSRKVQITLAGTMERVTSEFFREYELSDYITYVTETSAKLRKLVTRSFLDVASSSKWPGNVTRWIRNTAGFK